VRIAILLLLSAAAARADCGDQFYFVDPSSIPAKALRRAVGMVSYVGTDQEASTEPLHGFHDRKQSRPAVFPVGTTTPVSSMPTCNARFGFDGNVFIATEISTDAARIVIDYKTGKEVWVRIRSVVDGGEYRNYVRRFIGEGEPKDGSAVDIFFRHDRVKVYRSPRLSARFSVVSTQPRAPGAYHQRSAYYVMGRRNGFIQIGDTTEEGPLKALGWIKLRDASGALAVWPAYRDDC
jgi:hypothetical protein